MNAFKPSPDLILPVIVMMAAAHALGEFDAASVGERNLIGQVLHVRCRTLGVRQRDIIQIAEKTAAALEAQTESQRKILMSVFDGTTDEERERLIRVAHALRE